MRFLFGIVFRESGSLTFLLSELYPGLFVWANSAPRIVSLARGEVGEKGVFGVPPRCYSRNPLPSSSAHAFHHHDMLS